MENALEELPIVERDPWLRTYESALRSRYDLYRRRRDEIGQGGGIMPPATSITVFSTIRL